MNFKKWRIPTLLFLISLFLNTYGLWWGLPNYYTWSTDDLTPTAPLLIAKNSFKINSYYPVFHYVLLDVFYAPYLGYLYLTGRLIDPHNGFPYGFSDPLTNLTMLLVISRLVSAIMGGLAVVFVYLGVKTLYGKKAALFSSLCVAFSHIFILYAHLGNLDIPYTFWFTISLYVYARLLKTYKIKYYVLLGVFVALAVATKDSIGGFFVSLPIPLLYLHFKHHLKKLSFKKALFNKKLIYCLLALIITYLVAGNILVDFSGFKYRIDRWASGKETDPKAMFEKNFLGQIQTFQETFFKLEYSVGIGLFFLLLIGLFYCIYNFDDCTFVFLIPLISFYILGPGRVYYIWFRMTIPIIIILSFFAGRFLSDLVSNINVKKFVYSVIILIFVYSFLYGFSADLSLVYDSRHSAEDWMLENIDKDAEIEVYHDGRYLPRFHALGFKNVDSIFFYWNDSAKPPILLFNPVIDSPDLESLKIRNPDYIVLPGARSEELKHTLLPEGLEKKKARIKEIEKGREKVADYMDLLLSEKGGYKIVKVFDNKIPFAPEKTPYSERRWNIPVIILKKDT